MWPGTFFSQFPSLLIAKNCMSIREMVRAQCLQEVMVLLKKSTLALTYVEYFKISRETEKNHNQTLKCLKKLDATKRQNDI